HKRQTNARAVARLGLSANVQIVQIGLPTLPRKPSDRRSSNGFYPNDPRVRMLDLVGQREDRGLWVRDARRQADFHASSELGSFQGADSRWLIRPSQVRRYIMYQS